MSSIGLRFEDFLRRAHSQEVFVVSAANMLPGMLEGAIGVDSDAQCDREICRFRNGTFLASPYPRSIPGVQILSATFGSATFRVPFGC